MQRISRALGRRACVVRFSAVVPIICRVAALHPAHVRLLHATPAKYFPSAVVVQAVLSAQQAVDVLLNVAQWSSDAKGAGLTKSFQFKDARTARQFVDQVADLRSRARRPFSHSLLDSDTKSVVLSIPVEASGADAGKVGDEQVALAHAVDDIGAALQLQTGWG